MKPIQHKRPGSFTKSTQASVQLNELMLRYAQANNIAGVMGCLLKHADIDYKDGALLLTCVYLRHLKLLKLVLAKNPTAGLLKAIEIAEADNFDKGLQLLNNYLNRKNIKI